MTAAELAAAVEEIAPVVNAVADEMTTEMPLTEEEEQALGIAAAAIHLGEFGAEMSGDPWASASAALLAVLPIDQLVRLVESWRSTMVTAQEMEVVIGPLGAGVKVEGRG